MKGDAGEQGPPGRASGAVAWAARAAALVVLIAALAPGSVSAQAVDEDWAPPRTVFVPETGQRIDGLFLDLWRGEGGAATFGYPITPEIAEADGRVVQWYQYARFEYWPAGNADGEVLTLGAIGAELRPVAMPRMAFGGMESTPAGLTAEARAWLPLPEDKIRDDSATWRYVPESRHSVIDGFKAFWEATGEAAYLGNPLTEEYVLDGTSYQVFERGQLRWRPGEDIALVPVGERLAARYGLDTGPIDPGNVPTYAEALFVRPETLLPELAGAPAPPPGAAKSIVVSLAQQALWAYDGTEVVRSTYVSTGKERFGTPTGTFVVNTKLPVQDMAGVIGGEYYNVPQVPDVMYFTDVGHAIHGTYWHDNFGEPMSHGCVNVPMDVSKWLYDWAPVGTPVLIVA